MYRLFFTHVYRVILMYRMREVIRGLFVGNSKDASSLDDLSYNEISLIICAAKGQFLSRFTFSYSFQIIPVCSLRTWIT